MAKKKNLACLDESELDYIREKSQRESVMDYITSEGLTRTLKTLDFKLNVKCKNEKQKTFLQNLKNLDLKLNICDAPAGVGKSMLSLTAGLYHLKNGNVSKVIIIIPTVEASEATKIGLLPGSVAEKVYPFQMAMRSNLEKILKLSGNIAYEQHAKSLIDNGFVEFELLSYARGRTFDDAFIIIDEAENLSKKETLLLLGRIGDGNTKVALLGDAEQMDRKDIRSDSNCGLVHAKRVLSGVDGVSVDEFTNADIVRNTFITRIFEKWNGPYPEKTG